MEEPLTKPTRLGIFGGSFDPPHEAHLRLVTELQEKMSFDKIWIVPSKFPPEKTPVASYEKRFEWCQKLFNGSGFEVCNFEKNASMTIFGRDIFYHLRTLTPRAEFYWILGEDNWIRLPFWKDIDDYGGDLTWLVLKRSHNHISSSLHRHLLSRRLIRASCAYEWAPVNEVRDEISSSAIREGLMKRKPALLNREEWIPDSIRTDVVNYYQNLTRG